MTAWMHENKFQITSQITKKYQKTNLKFQIKVFSLMWEVIVDINNIFAIMCLEFNIFSCNHATMQPCNHAIMQPCNHATMQPCNHFPDS
jgi:hypothetical protein